MPGAREGFVAVEVIAVDAVASATNVGVVAVDDVVVVVVATAFAVVGEYVVVFVVLIVFIADVVVAVAGIGVVCVFTNCFSSRADTLSFNELISSKTAFSRRNAFVWAFKEAIILVKLFIALELSSATARRALLCATFRRNILRISKYLRSLSSIFACQSKLAAISQQS